MKLKKLVVDSRGADVARAYEDFRPTVEQLATLQRVGEEALRHFGAISHACAPMSAAYAARLEYELNKSVPILMVAGSLKVEGKWIYGDGRPFDGQVVFGGSNPSWDGHCWLMFGPYVADVSVRQTALSGKSHGSLEALVRRKFGEERGLLVMKWSEAPRDGFYYAPQYVLTDQEGAWLGLVPKQISTGDRTILGRISKRGNKYLRTLFVQAARVVLLWPRSWERYGLKPWIEAAARRLHHNVLAIALANKLARIAWSVLHHGRNFEVRKMSEPVSQPA